MTQEKLVRLQKELAKDILEVTVAKVCLRRSEKLTELNQRLDSLNRSAYYLRKGEK